MSKIIKKIKLNASQVEQVNTDPTKGTQANPFTQEEMHQLQAQESWNGGYVEGVGYMMPRTSGEPDSSYSTFQVLWIEAGVDIESDRQTVEGKDDFYVILNYGWSEGPARTTSVSAQVKTVQTPNTTNPYYEILSDKSYIHDVIIEAQPCYPFPKYARVCATYHLEYNKTIIKNGEPQTTKETTEVNFNKDVTERTYWHPAEK